MKQLWIFLTLTTILSINSYAQTEWQITAGPNTANFPFLIGEHKEGSHRPGYFFGGAFVNHLGYRHSLKLETVFAMKGANLSNDAGDKCKFLMPFINISGFYQFRVVKPVRLFTGLEFGWLLDATYVTETEKIDYYPYMRKYDLGLSLGMSVDISKTLMLDFRWIGGFLSMQTSTRRENIYVDLGRKYIGGETRSVRLGLTYKFINN